VTLLPFVDVHRKAKAFKKRTREANRSNAELRESRLVQEAKEILGKEPCPGQVGTRDGKEHPRHHELSELHPCQRTTVSSRIIKSAFFPVSPEPASYDPEEFVDGSQPWPRLLAFKDGELLAKGEVFEHQTAARPKHAKQGSEPEPKQVKHGNRVIAGRLCRLPSKLLIAKPDRIVTRDSRASAGVAWVHYGHDCGPTRFDLLLAGLLTF
jgi:hypothetical protein